MLLCPSLRTRLSATLAAVIRPHPEHKVSPRSAAICIGAYITRPMQITRSILDFVWGP